MAALPLRAALAAAEGGGGGLTDINFGVSLWTVVLFLLFAFVLGKFAWRPLLDLIELRERTVREHVEQAEQARDEAKQILVEQQELLRQAQQQREALLLKAMKEAEAIRADIVTHARTEAEHVVERARQEIERDKQLAILELRTHVADIAIEAAAKIVRSSMTVENQRALVDAFVTSVGTTRASEQ